MPKKRGPKVGRWANFSSVKVDGLQEAIAETLREYGDVVFQATEEGATAGAYALKDELQAATPTIKNPPKGYSRKNFGKHWKVIGEGKYKLMRFVGNSTVVSGKGGEPISLANIFEYSTTHGHPFIKDTFENSIDKVAAAVVAEIKKEV